MIKRGLLFLLALILISFIFLTSVSAQPPTDRIPLPDGSKIIVDNDNNNYISLANPDEFIIVSDNTGNIEYRRKDDPSGLPLVTEGSDITQGAVLGYDKDTGLYDQSYDPMAGVGVRNYFRKLNYKLKNSYMTKYIN